MSGMNMSFTDRPSEGLPGFPGKSSLGPGGGGEGGGGGEADTRERLLEAAGEVFAEVGFKEAKVRDICARAGANLAAVNYHFRDKETLYLAVFERARACAVEVERSVMAALPREDGAAGGAAGLGPEARLLLYVRAFLFKLFAAGKPGWHSKLMSREMIDPTAAMDMIVKGAMEPNFAFGMSIVRSFFGPGASERQIAMATASVVGQCLHYHHCRAVTNRVYPGWLEQPDFIEVTARHIWRFSVCALRGMASEPQWWVTESDEAVAAHRRMRAAGLDLGDGGMGSAGGRVAGESSEAGGGA